MLTSNELISSSQARKLLTLRCSKEFPRSPWRQGDRHGTHDYDEAYCVAVCTLSCFCWVSKRQNSSEGAGKDLGDEGSGVIRNKEVIAFCHHLLFPLWHQRAKACIISSKSFSLRRTSGVDMGSSTNSSNLV